MFQTTSNEVVFLFKINSLLLNNLKSNNYESNSVLDFSINSNDAFIKYF